jgi:Ring finger domain
MMFGGIHMGGSTGDVVWSQEEFDRIMSQLMEQSGRNAPGPASADAISTLPKRTVDQNMIGDTGKAECTICMDEVAVGDVVTELYCKHWFHTQCITVWLNEHDTCPHCRKGIETAKEEAEAANSKPKAPNKPSSPSRRPSSSSVNANNNSPNPESSSSSQLPRRSSRNRSIHRDHTYDSLMDRDHTSTRPPRSGRSTPPSLHRRPTGSSANERPLSSSNNDLPTVPRRSSIQPRRSSGSPRDRFPSDSYPSRDRDRDRERERELDYSYRDADPSAFRPGAYPRERERDQEREHEVGRDQDERYGSSRSNSRSIASHRRHGERDRFARRDSEDRGSGSYRGSRDGFEDRDRSGNGSGGGATSLLDRARRLFQNRGGHS